MKKKIDIIMTRDDLKDQLAPDKQTTGSLFILGSNGMIKDRSGAFTIELPWKDNKQNISCIPANIYPFVILEKSYSFDYPHFYILNVPNRSEIKFHIANHVSDLLGCVGPGNTEYRDINGDGLIDVEDSRKTLERLIEIMRKIFKETGRTQGYIEIRDNFTNEK